MKILLVTLIGIFTIGVHGQNRAPEWIQDMNGYTIMEDMQVGQIVYRLRGTDPENDPLEYAIISDYFEVQNPSSGEVVLMKPLDYDDVNNRQIEATVFLSDSESSNSRQVTVIVLDANDNYPVFNSTSFLSSVSESEPIGNRVFNIEVYDRDTQGSDLTVTCVNTPAETENVCELFRVEATRAGRQYWRGVLTLQKPLDYETKQNFTITLEAFDGVHKTAKTVNLRVEDAQDMPPKFTSQLNAQLEGIVAQGTVVLTVKAEDGDTGPSRRPIRYSLFSNPGNMFRIDPISGEITTTRELRSDAVQVQAQLQNGVITLGVQAGEVIEGNAVGTTRFTSVRGQVRLSFRNVNDNPPRFNPTTASVFVDENTAGGTQLVMVPPIVTVTDGDSGINANFEILLEEYGDIFEVRPTTASKTTQVMLYLRQGAQLDYDRGTKSYTLHFIARETDTNPKLQGDAYVTVTVRDVNDNAPVFSQSQFTFNVRETAPGGTNVGVITATDIDERPFGQTSIRYKLVGNGAEKFRVNPITGQITVRPCPGTPGRGPECLDFETKNTYQLSFYARDSYGEGQTTVVPVTITVGDENDNSPIFTLSNYTTYIDEGQTVPNPRLQVQATDRDSGTGVAGIRYSIIGGNWQTMWQIDATTGVITATRPVQYEDTPNIRGYFQLIVRATDGLNEATAQAWIIVRDGNDHTPVFVPSDRYEEWIAESSPPGTSVVTVRATDQDPASSPNGQVSYRIQAGSDNKFVIGATTGLISVAPGATFDYDVKRQYIMTVLGMDNGQPKRSATATVTVNIRDSNNKKPYFDPSSVSINVRESETTNTVVTTMRAVDPDANAVLQYSIIEAMGWDTNGRVVTTTNAMNLFRIDSNTGDVRVNSRLERDEVARISYTVHVRDSQGDSDQTATATLLINILDVNSRPPIFENPWSPSNQYLTMNARENEPRGVYVDTITATDPDNTGITYTMIDNPGGFFVINSNTGVVTVGQPLDYETIQNTQFVVRAEDSGNPALSSTATVRVNVININDETPIFNPRQYNVSLDENPQNGMRLVQVTATDKDLGDYGIVRYRLTDPNLPFSIDPMTGWITVIDANRLDRENANDIDLIVQAYDSPNNQTVRRFASTTVSIHLKDRNDNRPRFNQDRYYGVVSETDPVTTYVVQVIATDADTGVNGYLTYYITGGTGRDMFQIDERTGNITTKVPLRGRPGTYNLTVGVRDGGTPSLNSTAVVLITVRQTNNGPPRWIRPFFNNESINVLEEQYVGMRVYDAYAIDDDAGQNGLVTYSFRIGRDDTTQTEQFTINPLTGVITANVPFDRESRDTYTLILVARDNGSPVLESTRTLTVRITDVDDHNPEFPQNKTTCCPLDYRFSLRENQTVGYQVGKVEAIDLDIGENADTKYFIVGGNADGTFRIDEVTGIIYTNRPLDLASKSVYNLQVRAIPSTDRFRPQCACQDASVVNVIITIIPKDRLPPVFLQKEYQACVSVDAPIGKSVTTVRAVDYAFPDGKVYYQINSIDTHSLPGGDYIPATGDEFIIGLTNGSIHTKMLMSLYKASYFELKVASSAEPVFQSLPGTDVRIWVTEAAQEIQVTVREPPDEVRDKLSEITGWIQKVTNGDYVCVNDIRYHLRDGHYVDTEWTDLLIHVVSKNGQYVWGADEITNILWPPKVDQTDGIAVGIVAIRPAYDMWSVFDYAPLVIAIVFIILLLLLALLLLCCCCWLCAGCCGGDEEEKELMMQPLVMPATVNPLWKEKLYEDQELRMNVDHGDLELTNINLLGHVNRGLIGDADEVDAGAVRGAQMANGTARLVMGGGDTVESRTETTNEYTMSYERTQTNQVMDGAGGAGGEQQMIMNGNATRIEAGLEPRYGTSAGSTLSVPAAAVNLRNPVTNTGVQVDGSTGLHGNLSQSVPTNLQDRRRAGQSGIGATLYSSETDLLSELSYSIKSDGPNSPTGYGAEGTYHATWRPDDADDFVDGMYQGEILLGNVQPGRYNVHETRTERYYSDGGAHPGVYENIHDNIH